MSHTKNVLEATIPHCSFYIPHSKALACNSHSPIHQKKEQRGKNRSKQEQMTINDLYREYR